MKVNPEHSLQDLFGTAIKAEIEAQEVYSRIKEHTENLVLKDKMGFLTGEEKRHEHILRGLFKKQFPDQKPSVPEETVAPVPAWHPEKGDEVSTILQAAMQTEEDAKNFYLDMSKRVEDPEVRSMLGYLAAMEQTHYHLLETEFHAAKDIEYYDRFDPAVHWGA